MPQFPFHILSHYDLRFAELDAKVAELGRRAAEKVESATSLTLNPLATVEGWPDHPGAILADDLAAIDHHVIAFLARYHPVAGDLRRALAALRAVGALERICDHAIDVIDTTVAGARRPNRRPPPPERLTGRVHDIGHLALRLLRDVLAEQAGGQAVDAAVVTARERAIERRHHEVAADILDHMAAAPATIEGCAELLLAASGFERIAHATLALACSAKRDPRPEVGGTP